MWLSLILLRLLQRHLLLQLQLLLLQHLLLLLLLYLDFKLLLLHLLLLHLELQLLIGLHLLSFKPGLLLGLLKPMPRLTILHCLLGQPLLLLRQPLLPLLLLSLSLLLPVMNQALILRLLFSLPVLRLGHCNIDLNDSTIAPRSALALVAILARASPAIRSLAFTTLTIFAFAPFAFMSTALTIFAITPTTRKTLRT